MFLLGEMHLVMTDLLLQKIDCRKKWSSFRIRWVYLLGVRLGRLEDQDELGKGCWRRLEKVGWRGILERAEVFYSSYNPVYEMIGQQNRKGG